MFLTKVIREQWVRTFLYVRKSSFEFLLQRSKDGDETESGHLFRLEKP
jgi:hypothetical protein